MSIHDEDYHNPDFDNVETDNALDKSYIIDEELNDDMDNTPIDGDIEDNMDQDILKDLIG